MVILTTGVDYDTGKLLTPPIDDDEFGRKVKKSIGSNLSDLGSSSNRTISPRGVDFSYFLPRASLPEIDRNDPRKEEVGWTYIINRRDKNKTNIIDCIYPLAEFRGMKNPDDPILYDDMPEEKRFSWVDFEYHKAEGKGPYYALIIGGPDDIPFSLQNKLQRSNVSVGRLPFESKEDLEQYVSKIIKFEKNNQSVVDSNALFFAPDGGISDPTYFSCHCMAEPLSNQVREKFGFGVDQIFGRNATKKNLINTFSKTKAALIYTASHGYFATDQPIEVKKRINGAICCQKTGLENSEDDNLFGSTDVPQSFDQPFLEGSIVFQFACFSLGTPRESIYNKWIGQQPLLNSSEDFIASFPKKLLAHPRGPVGFIGHLDLAYLHAFHDPRNLNFTTKTYKKWNARLRPFVMALDVLIKKRWTIGRALEEMATRSGLGADQLLERQRQLHESSPPTSEITDDNISDDFIYYTDSKNYFLLGDPAAKLLMK